jgi:hypothetical protein
MFPRNVTSTQHAPWFIVPADDKNNARLIISRIIVDMLKQLRISCPEAGKARHKELKSFRKQL